MRYFTLIIITLFTLSLSSQNCYQNIGEYKGIDNSIAFTELDNESCSLRQSFPTLQQDSFKVFDIDLYYLSNYQLSGIEGAWNKAKNSNELSAYYLLFARDSGSEKIYDIDLKLPDNGPFECLDIISNDFTNSIIEELKIVVFSNTGRKYNEIEILVVQRLNEIIENILTCCNNSYRSKVTCSACSILQSDKESEIVRLHRKLDQYGFAFELVENIIDPDYNISSLKFSKESKDKKSIIPINAIVDFTDSIYVELDFFGTSFSNLFPNNSVNFHYFKYPRDCGAFDDIWNNYQNDNSDYSVFVALLNIDNNKGIVAFHFNSKFVYGSQNNREISSSNCDEICQAAEGLYEIAEKENVCSNLLLSYGQRFEYKVSRFFNDIILSEKDKAYYEDYYNRRNKDSNKNLTQSQTNWTYYYSSHYDYYHKKKGKWRITSWVKARLDLCSFVIHTALDLCGLGDPFVGPICDAGNSLLYILEGDHRNAVLSAAATAPVIGHAITQTKLGGKLARVSWSSIKYQLSFSFDIYENGIKWVGKHSKLKKSFRKVGNEIPFKNLNYDPFTNPVHHLIPYEMVNDLNKTAINYIGGERVKKLAKLGWHPSDIQLNGYVIPAKFPNGNTFHAQHTSGYSTWVSVELKKILDNTPDNQVLDKMKIFAADLRKHIEDAWDAGDSINDYFKKL